MANASAVDHSPTAALVPAVSPLDEDHARRRAQWAEWGERWDLFCALPERVEAILDVGCGAGMDFLSYRRRGVRVVGADFDERALALAAGRLDEVLQINLDAPVWPAALAGAFDVVAFCDSLEHLRDPWGALRSVKALLRPGGVVVASIPNVRQIRVIMKLVLGRWDYGLDYGIVNRHHLRFFTRATINELFTEAGYGDPRFYFPAQTMHLRRPERLLRRLAFGRLNDFLYNSYTVSASPS